MKTRSFSHYSPDTEMLRNDREEWLECDECDKKSLYTNPLLLQECLQFFLWSQFTSSGPAHAQFGPIHFKVSCEPSPDSILSPSNLNSSWKRLHGGRLPFPARLCGCLEMESYEEFCLRSLVRLQESGETKETPEPQRLERPHSVIRFHGRAVLSPLVRKKTLKIHHGKPCDELIWWLLVGERRRDEITD